MSKEAKTEYPSASIAWGGLDKGATVVDADEGMTDVDRQVLQWSAELQTILWREVASFVKTVHIGERQGFRVAAMSLAGMMVMQLRMIEDPADREQWHQWAEMCLRHSFDDDRPAS